MLQNALDLKYSRDNLKIDSNYQCSGLILLCTYFKGCI